MRRLLRARAACGPRSGRAATKSADAGARSHPSSTSTPRTNSTSIDILVLPVAVARDDRRDLTQSFSPISPSTTRRRTGEADHARRPVIARDAREEIVLRRVSSDDQLEDRRQPEVSPHTENEDVVDGETARIPVGDDVLELVRVGLSVRKQHPPAGCAYVVIP